MLKKITVEDAIQHLLHAEEYDWLNYNDIEMLQFICKLAEDSARAQGILTMDFNEAVHYKQSGAQRYLRSINGRVEYITDETYRELKKELNNQYADTDSIKHYVESDIHAGSGFVNPKEGVF